MALARNRENPGSTITLFALSGWITRPLEVMHSNSVGGQIMSITSPTTVTTPFAPSGDPHLKSFAPLPPKYSALTVPEYSTIGLK